MPDNTPQISNGYSLGNSMSLGWQILKNNYWPLIGVCFTAMLIIGFGVAISALIPFGDMVFAVLVASPVSVGRSWWVVLPSRGEKPSMGTLFAVFSDKYWVVVSISFLVLLIYYAIFVGVILVGAAIGGASLAVIYAAADQMEAGKIEDIDLGAMLVPLIFALIIGGLLSTLVLVRLMWAGLIAMDPEEDAKSVGECLRRCWRMTAQSWFSLFFLVIILSIIMMLSFILLCVGFFLLGVPLYVATTVGAYVLMRQ